MSAPNVSTPVLSVGACLSAGWRRFRARPWLFVLAGLLLLFVNLCINFLQSIAEWGAETTQAALLITLVGLLSAAVGMAISFFVSMGETAFFLKAERDAQTTRLEDLWHPRPFWAFAGATLLSGAIVLLGFVLLIVPGIIASVLLMFVGYLVIDQGLRPVAAIKESVRLTKGNRWRLFLLSLAIIGINILGLLALVVGLLVSVPVSFLATAHAYRLLSAAPALEAAPETPALA
jgi:uncharacterized membrane protein